ncbi:hypothetical protein A2U01_0036572, partial [Trifolium medium]|nr:hypothetical protein [Trifolium medium]
CSRTHAIPAASRRSVASQCLAATGRVGARSYGSRPLQPGSQWIGAEWVASSISRVRTAISC